MPRIAFFTLLQAIATALASVISSKPRHLRALRDICELKADYKTWGPIQREGKRNGKRKRAKENGDGKGNCNIQRYKMGIIADATINSTDGATFQAPAPANLNTSMTKKKAIIKAVKKEIGTLENVTLERLVVLPFTAPFNTTPNGTYGYWTFTPAMQCWRGYPKDCSGELEEDLDGYPVWVCGFRLKSNGTDRMAPPMKAMLVSWRGMKKMPS
ncbi:uncharacterized protein BKA55DRAFT_546444 [Fusarium redolens]|uniref:Uncharacterized protein n=1 Tax=Fusarium redolens TaxID=48865 RepID=A0A9P9FYM5_FUSRE|nr:uncharacterized protein BKA55DRAFT_546444 [Fusarium redolens]KAH7217021.1 hypothetical protein BKA55DRAFT_546444 [Fusarium redolens]